MNDTAAKIERDDDLPPIRESEPLPEIAPDPVAQREAWTQRFIALGDEMKEQGVTLMWAAASHDPLENETVPMMGYRGNMYTAVGLCRCLERWLVESD